MLIIQGSGMSSAYALGAQNSATSDNRILDAGTYTRSIVFENDFESVVQRSTPTSLHYHGFSHGFAQSQKAEFKSRSEIMSQVKRRYDAKILKISLNKAREVYVVRLLMPNGKVKTIQVSARS